MIGSRSQERAAATVEELQARWHGWSLALAAGDNTAAAGAELVVLATPWEGAVPTVSDLAPQLAGKTLVTMVNAMTRLGQRMAPLVLPTGSVAVALAQAVPKARVVGAFHHLPAGPLGDPAATLDCDVMVFGELREAKDELIQVVNEVPGLRGVDVGGLASGLAVEALTAALVEVNRRYKVHSAVRVTGLP